MDSEYEVKAIDLGYSKKKAKKDTYVILSPSGNQYVVKTDKLEEFKTALKVDKDWEIK